MRILYLHTEADSALQFKRTRDRLNVLLLTYPVLVHPTIQYKHSADGTPVPALPYFVISLCPLPTILEAEDDVAPVEVIRAWCTHPAVTEALTGASRAPDEWAGPSYMHDFVKATADVDFLTSLMALDWHRCRAMAADVLAAAPADQVLTGLQPHQSASMRTALRATLLELVAAAFQKSWTSQAGWNASGADIKGMSRHDGEMAGVDAEGERLVGEPGFLLELATSKSLRSTDDDVRAALLQSVRVLDEAALGAGKGGDGFPVYQAVLRLQQLVYELLQVKAFQSRQEAASAVAEHFFEPGTPALAAQQNERSIRRFDVQTAEAFLDCLEAYGVSAGDMHRMIEASLFDFTALAPAALARAARDSMQALLHEAPATLSAVPARGPRRGSV